ncbi:hypothetical protein P691DRAFT_789063 [Macrolepiota fuliginosa MF-IS2]|uniref:F-box domain-containing protein n=1 Tax=Macrolepiota fuliginosa MF-IS2 TaxID=1400762 RepID=A0A9P6BYR8_9AGAR|nr:hypothetical protein P691DRAFT_789063 [Macrolepiota fuliginosa MF-IS2]
MAHDKAPSTLEPWVMNEPLTPAQELDIRTQTNHAVQGIEKCAETTEGPNTLTRSQTFLSFKVHLIPNEIWAEIFGWFAKIWCTFGVAAPSHSAWVLGQVCRRWRQLALSMPQLWNHPPTVHITPDSSTYNHIGRGWEEFLYRSAHLPLKLHFSFDVPLTTPPRPYSILSPFFHCTERWEHITISGLTVVQTQQQFYPVRDSGVPLLRSITFNFIETPFNSAISSGFNVFEFAPQLTQIYLHSPSASYRKSRLCFPWPQLTSYKETGIDMGTFPIVLNLSKNMERLQYRGMNFIGHSVDHVTHSHLRHLFVEAGSLQHFRLRDVTLPALETFSLVITQGGSRRRLPSISLVVDMLVRSACPLKNLVLDFYSDAIGTDVLKPLLSTPELENLELGSCHHIRFAKSVLRKLIYDKEDTTLLPYLRSLTLIYREEFGHDAIATILDVASSREKIIPGDHSPGQLHRALKNIRIVSPNVTIRYRALCKFGKWVDPLEAMYDDPTFQHGQTPVEHMDTVADRVRRDCQRIPLHGNIPTCDPLSVLALAYMAEGKARYEILADFGRMGILPALQSYMIHHRWLPGCEDDIIYVHPDHNTAATLHLWEIIQRVDVKRLKSLFGYRVMSEEAEDDLKGVDA